MTVVVTHGTPLVEDPDRVGAVENLGVDETSFLRANRTHPTRYATGLVDTDAGVLIDLVEGNSAADLREWCVQQPQEWLAGISTVAIDLTDSYRAGLSPHLDHAWRVADPFHVVRVANRCLDQVRRRVQNETKGHRGRKDDPLYRIRKLLLKGAERLDDGGRDRILLGLRVGEPHDEVAGAFCFAHALQRAAERLEARRRGGRATSKLHRVRRLAPPVLVDLFEVLEKALDEVHGGELGPPQGQAMAALGRVMVTVAVSGELEERLRAVEQAVLS